MSIISKYQLQSCTDYLHQLLRVVSQTEDLLTFYNTISLCQSSLSTLSQTVRTEEKKFTKLPSHLILCTFTFLTRDEVKECFYVCQPWLEILRSNIALKFLRKGQIDLRFITKWQISNPNCITSDPNYLYLSSLSNYLIRTISLNGLIINQWTSSFFISQKYRKNIEIGINSSHDCLGIVDEGNRRFFLYTKQGTLIRGWNARISNFIFDKDLIYAISDYQIIVYTLEGTIIRQWGSPGKNDSEFNHPSGITIYNKELYILEQSGHCVQVFTLEGKFLRKWGKNGTDPGCFSYPTCIAISGNGIVYVSDTENRRIQVFDTQGEFLFLKEFSFSPKWFTILRDFLYVVNEDGHSIEIYHL